MAVTVEMLKQKIAHLQQELSEVSDALDELAGAPSQNGTSPAAKRDPLAGIRFSDPKELLPLFDAAMVKMGIDVTQPAMHPIEVQEMMLREGIRPEQNLLSSGIIEAREE
jgi:hypothetical protein